MILIEYSTLVVYCIEKTTKNKDGTDNVAVLCVFIDFSEYFNKNPLFLYVFEDFSSFSALLTTFRFDARIEQLILLDTLFVFYVLKLTSVVF